MLKDWISLVMLHKQLKRMKSVYALTAPAHWVLRSLPLTLRSVWEWGETVRGWQKSQCFLWHIHIRTHTHARTHTTTLIRQKTPTNESEHEPSDDNEDDWSYHSEKVSGSKKMRKDKPVTSSPRRGTTSRGPGRPSKLAREMEEINLSKVNLLC